ncbi:thymidine kinase [Ilyobacter polytropus]|uniref:Multifunctional fusion protein n=1 Tax=Ilyobacter polytropus (strain ATCC 51220 / DSM 2926 / LMG 16218 / CuHBu1) TaxID=572544 RepID=E3H8R7_ILYPC|nr:thymidine kinase [Ilyobacter polytropus]ADO83331.1 dethiobiotin synthase [Ilyobacter polytropus DSM 2926]
MHFLLTEGMGWIEVITGGMFSGKSEELIRRLIRSKYASQKVVAFKHSIDKRYDESNVVSHSSIFIEGVPAASVKEMEKIFYEKYSDAEVIGIDEVQFFGEPVVEFCEKLSDMGKRVIVAGLDQDFRGEPFEPIDSLLAKAEYVDKLSAICAVCGNPASRTQRLVNGEPAYYNDPVVLVGASESYEARCRKCHVVKREDNKEGKLYFIVGTDTDIGKTYAGLKLVKQEMDKGLKVTAIKPVETGSETFPENLEGSDSYAYARLLGKNVEDVNIFFYKKPMSPDAAAEADETSVDIKTIKEKIDKELLENDVVFVEGAGGLLVPFVENYMYLDLLVDYRKKSEVILISGNVLGTINHTLLTIDVLKRNDIKIKGVVFNNKENIEDKKFLKNNVETVKRIGKVEILAENEYGE